MTKLSVRSICDIDVISNLYGVKIVQGQISF
jgi:hypothetical protein